MKNKFCIILFLLSAILAFPYIYFGMDAYLTVHDNLDSEFIYLHVLKISKLLFSLDRDAVIPNIMNGLPRSFIHSEFSFIRILFYLLPSFWAYVVNNIIIRIIGFVGMYLLARDYLLKGYCKNSILALSFIFSLIPLYSLYGISVTGQPLLIWAFLNLSLHYKSAINWLIIGLFPFYSHFALIAPFLISALMVWGIYRLIANDINIWYFVGIFLLTVSFIIANYAMIKGFFFPGDFISHRTEFWSDSYSLKKSLFDSAFAFVAGHNTASSFKVVPFYVYVFIVFFFAKINTKEKKDIFLLLLAIGFIALFHGFYPVIGHLVQHKLGITLTFRLSRFFFLIPMLWFILFTITLKSAANKIHPVITWICIVAQVILIIPPNKELSYNYANIFHYKNNICANIVKYEGKPRTIGNLENIVKGISFNAFFSAELFDEIAEYIGKPQKNYRVVSLGLYPCIAQYNGFYTLDSYQNNYLAKYKHEFREIIAGELDKNTMLKKGYDYVGSKCYLVSDALDKSCFFLCTNQCNYSDPELNINISALKSMGGEYIISAIPIYNFKNLNLELEKEFSGHGSLWNIYLYHVK